jgi:hypothetical protein
LLPKADFKIVWGGSSIKGTRFCRGNTMKRTQNYIT